MRRGRDQRCLAVGLAGCGALLAAEAEWEAGLSTKSCQPLTRLLPHRHQGVPMLLAEQLQLAVALLKGEPPPAAAAGSGVAAVAARYRRWRGGGTCSVGLFRCQTRRHCRTNGGTHASLHAASWVGAQLRETPAVHGNGAGGRRQPAGHHGCHRGEVWRAIRPPIESAPPALQGLQYKCPACASLGPLVACRSAYAFHTIWQPYLIAWRSLLAAQRL